MKPRFDRATGALALGLVVGTALPALAQDRAALMEQHRGGTMRLVARAAEGTIDPHINYTLKNWQFYQFIYDGLVAFKKASNWPMATSNSPSLSDACAADNDASAPAPVPLCSPATFT